MTVDVVVPAHNEADRIAGVLDAISQSPSVGRIIVVADACTDSTAAIAVRWASEIVRIDARDKGTAMAAGLGRVTTADVLFVDADLLGLTAGHVEFLATAAPAGGMVVGLRDELTSAASRALPPISGQRRLPVHFARMTRLRGSGYRAEILLDAAVGRAGLPHAAYVLPGVKNPTRAATDPLGWLGMFAQVAITAIAHLPSLARFAAGSTSPA